MPALLNVGALLGLVIFVYAVAGLNLFTYVAHGDALNAANQSRRHKLGLSAVHRALTAVTPPRYDNARVVLCDKGDGTTSSRAEHQQRWAHLCATDIPDAARLSLA